VLVAHPGPRVDLTAVDPVDSVWLSTPVEAAPQPALCCAVADPGRIFCDRPATGHVGLPGGHPPA
jgi:hypothetical protein